MKGLFGDVVKTVQGQDLEDDAPKRDSKRIEKTGKKSGKKGKTQTSENPDKPARKSKVADDAKFAAYDYANDAKQLSADVREALKTGNLSGELSKLLQVLFDKQDIRDLAAAQGDVCPPPPGPDEYYLSYRFVNPDNGDWCNDEAEALLESGKSIDDLKKFNMELRVVRLRKLDDSEISEGTPEDYEEIRKQIEEAA